MFSKTLVISAEHNFECSVPSKKRIIRNYPTFSETLDKAYQEHKQICEEWRAAGRPVDNDHLLKMQKL